MEPDSPFSSLPSPRPPPSHLPVLDPAPTHVPPPEAADRARHLSPPEAEDDGEGVAEGPPRLVWFVPTDQELVTEYLARRVLGLPIPVDFMVEIELYNVDPDDLPPIFPSTYDRESRYFFTLLKRKYLVGNDLSRSTPGGHWRACGRQKPIMDAAGVLIGFKRMLVFHIRKTDGDKRTKWKMQEFRLNAELDEFRNLNHPEVGNYVLCKVYCSARPKRSPTVTVSPGMPENDEAGV